MLWFSYYYVYPTWNDARHIIITRCLFYKAQVVVRVHERRLQRGGAEGRRGGGAEETGEGEARGQMRFDLWNVSGVTILLSLTVFLNLVAETLPQVSDAIPLLGTPHPTFTIRPHLLHSVPNSIFFFTSLLCVDHFHFDTSTRYFVCCV